MSVFSSVKAAPPIEVFQLGRDFAADTNPKKVQCVQWVYCVQCVQCEVYDFKLKVSLGVGAYRTPEGKPWILPVVKKAEKILAEQVTLDAVYLVTNYSHWTKT